MGGMVWRWCEYKGVNERGHTAPVHHCHTPHTPSGTKGGGVQPRECQLKVCHWGRSWMRRDLLIHWESMNIKVIVHLVLNSLCEDQEVEKVKGSTKGNYTIQTTNLLPSCTLPPNLFFFTLLLSLPHSSSPSSLRSHLVPTVEQPPAQVHTTAPYRCPPTPACVAPFLSLVLPPRPQPRPFSQLSSTCV